MAISSHPPADMSSSRWRDAISPGGWLLLALCYLISCWDTVVTRTQWGPDSRLYLAWAYRYLGYSELDAAHRTRDFLYGIDGVGVCPDLCFVPGYEYGYFHGANGAVVAARPLYPLLSAPFVALFGPNGMLVIPVLSYAFVLVGVAVLAHRLWGRQWGMLAALLVLLPATVSRWSVMGQTEGLAIALTVACLLTLPLGTGRPARDPAAPGASGAYRRRALLAFGVLLLLNLFVRQFAIALTGGVLAAYLVSCVRERRLRTGWLGYAVVGVLLTGLCLAGQAWATNRWFGGAALDLHARYTRITSQNLHTTGLASVPKVLHLIAVADYHYLRIDLIALATLALFVVALVLRPHTELTALALAAFLVTMALNVVVIWPTGYRYQAPIHPLTLLAALAVPAAVAGWRHRFRALGVPVAGWLLVGAGVLLGVRVIWHRDHLHVPRVVLLAATLALAGSAALVLLTATARYGTAAGLVAALAVPLSSTVVSLAIGSVRLSAVLVCAAAALACLPWDRGSARVTDPPAAATGPAPPGAVPTSVPAAPGGSLTLPAWLGLPAWVGWPVLAGSALLAVLAAAQGLALGVGALTGWVAAAVAARSVRNRWTAPALATLTGAGLGLVGRLLLARHPWGNPGMALGTWARIAASARAVGPDRVLTLLCLLGVLGVLAAWRRPVGGYGLGVLATAGTLALLAGGRAGFAGLLVCVPVLVAVVADLLSRALGTPAATGGPAGDPEPDDPVPVPAEIGAPAPAAG